MDKWQDPNFKVHKATAYVPISTEMAIDCGLITEKQARAQGWNPAPPIQIPWRRRLRWRLQAFINHIRLRVGSWIAGVDLSDRE